MGRFIFHFHEGGWHGKYKTAFYKLIILKLDNTN